jgi:hypothetical protein
MLLRWESRCSPGCRPARPAGIELAASLANAQTYLPPPPAAGFLVPLPLLNVVYSSKFGGPREFAIGLKFKSKAEHVIVDAEAALVA